MTRRVRKIALALHLTVSIGWVGAVVAYLVVGVAATTSRDDATIRGAWIAMELIGWWAIVPLALATLGTGILMAIGTPWGLFSHYWVLVSLGLTAFATVILLIHMPDVSLLADAARVSTGADLQALGGDLFHAGTGLVILLAVLVLNVLKPAGLTRYGWKRQQDARSART